MTDETPISWPDLPPLSALRAFAAYAQTGSVQQAGTALNVSHAAISQQIRNLEDHLGVALLDRSGRQAQLTEDGVQLAEALGEGFARIASTVADLTGREAARPLHITTTPSFAAGWLLPRLGDFRSHHPDIDLVIDPNPNLSDPKPGGVDVALRYGAGSWPGLESEMLLPSGVAVVAAPSLIGTRDFADLNALNAYPWLQELGTSEASDWMRDFGITGQRSAGLTSLPGNMVLEAVRAGQGVTVQASVWVAEDVAAGRLVKVREDREEQGYYIVTRPGVARPPLKALLRWLRRQRRTD